MSAAPVIQAPPPAGEAVLRVPQGSCRVYRGEPAAHDHAHAQVLLGLAGRLELEVAGRPTWVDAEQGVLIPPGMRHAYQALDAAAVWVIDCPAGDVALERWRRFAPPPGWAPAEGHAQLLRRLLQAPRLLPRRALDESALRRRVSAALHEPWPNDRLAALVHLSPARFRARWLAATGQAPQAWLRRLRLDVAARLLAAGVPLETAALQVCYGSASALSAALRRERGQGARGLRRA